MTDVYEYWREAIIDAFNTLDVMDEKDINKSTIYDVVHEGKQYPPKEVYRFAIEFLQENYPEINIPTLGGGKPINRFIEKFGFEVIEKGDISMIEKIQALLNTPYFKELLASNTFYFSELSALFKQYKDFDIELIKKDIEAYLNNEPKNFNFQELIDNSTGDFNHFLMLIAKLISIFDEKGYNKKVWNPYQDKRVVSRSMLSQKYWTGNLLKYKLLDFDDDYLQNEAAEAFKHSINFINQPNINVNIVSKNHRNDIVAYFKLDNDNAIVNLFSDELRDLKSEINKGVIVSQLLYNPEIKKIWLKSIIGLMASDSTGWFNDFVLESNKHNYSIVWNSKKPSGTAATLRALRNIINEDGGFNLYYSSNNKINYVARIVDFAKDDQDYQKKNWNNVHTDMYGFNNLFSEYKDDNKKANIVFLCESFKKMKPIDRSKFKVFKPYSYPTQDNLTPLQSEPEIDIIEDLLNKDIEKNKKVMKGTFKTPLNQILFGPPGTGKTYNIINEALKIIDPEFYKDNSASREALNKRFKELLIKKWDETKGQIAFCTFHQSFSYEDFVEGIKPETNEGKVTYDIQNGIFKNICQLADSNLSILKVRKEGKLSWNETEFNRASFYKLSLGDSQKSEDREIYEYCRDHNYIAVGFGDDIDFSGLTESEIKETLDAAAYKGSNAQMLNCFIHLIKNDNYVLISNGNQYVRALGRVVGDYEYNPNAPIRYNHFRKVEWIFTDENIPIEEIYEVGLSQRTVYKIDDNRLKPDFFVHKGQQYDIHKESEKNYVLIVDEINRGNVSSIFGELITLIEPDKRAGMPEELEVILPYSKQSFKVPHNVHIIGTMNTADRSIEALDTALRRRFSFIEMPPKPMLIETESLSGTVNGVVDGINLKDLLKTINKRIEKLIDKDHKIGHSYFLKVNDKTSLIHCFKNEVIPLLEEYFFGDYGKIGLVLGDSFIDRKDTDFTFSKFKHYDSDIVEDLKSKAVFKITNEANWDFNTI
jgi:5-methylcytosine-specific restriction protein B